MAVCVAVKTYQMSGEVLAAQGHAGALRNGNYVGHGAVGGGSMVEFRWYLGGTVGWTGLTAVGRLVWD